MQMKKAFSPTQPKTTQNRLLNFGLIFILCLLFMIVFLYMAFSVGSGLVLLYVPYAIAIIALLGMIYWFYRYRDWFETILVYITLCASLLSFLIMAPIVVERSLSCFVYFSAVEDGFTSPEGISDDFIKSFVQKRFDDGVKGGFLRYQAGTYVPTFRAKLFYTLYYPLGILTHTLDNYKNFKASYAKNHKPTHQ